MQFFNRFLDLFLGIGIQRTSCFVKNKNRWIYVNRTRNCQALSLPSRKLHPSIPYHSLIPIGIIYHEFMNMGKFRSLKHFSIIRILLPE